MKINNIINENPNIPTDGILDPTDPVVTLTLEDIQQLCRPLFSQDVYRVNIPLNRIPARLVRACTIVWKCETGKITEQERDEMLKRIKR